MYSVCCTWEQSEIDTFVNSALFGFTAGLVLRNTTQWGNTRLSGFRTIIYRSNCKSILWGLKSKRVKLLDTLIKGPSGWQSVKMLARRQNDECSPMTVSHITYNCYFLIFSHKWELQSFHNHFSTFRLFPIHQVEIHIERTKIWHHTGDNICWGTWRQYWNKHSRTA